MRRQIKKTMSYLFWFPSSEVTLFAVLLRFGTVPQLPPKKINQGGE